MSLKAAMASSPYTNRRTIRQSHPSNNSLHSRMKTLVIRLCSELDSPIVGNKATRCSSSSSGRALSVSRDYWNLTKGKRGNHWYLVPKPHALALTFVSRSRNR